MSAEEKTAAADRDAQVDEVIAAYLQSAQSGQAPDRQALLAQHPHLADELDAFFADQDHFHRLAGPLRPEASAMLDAEPTLTGPDIESQPFGDYHLLEEIARGGMGVVFKARQISLNRTVAVKMILAGQLASVADVQRFRREAEAAAHLDHPNIVPIYEVGIFQGQHYFGMKLVEGGSLAHRMFDFQLPNWPNSHSPVCTRGSTALPPSKSEIENRKSKIATLMAKVARAVDHAHKHGILHRDLKPGNILVDVNGEPHVTDFGLAKRVEGGATVTQAGAVVGTPSYMAPEQAAGQGSTLTAQADVYSLGAILYELLTGQPPFKGDSSLDTILQLLEQEPERPRAVNPAVDRSLEAICLKCLERDPQRRYMSAQELAEDLQRYLDGEPIVARPPGVAGRLLRWGIRRPALAVTFMALAIFYGIHVLCMYALRLPGEQGSFHWFVTALVSCWALGACCCQWLICKPGWGTTALFGWVTMETILFTLLLAWGNGPASALLPGYFLLLGGAALRFRLAVLWFATIGSVAGYLALALHTLWHRPELAVPSYSSIIFVMSLAVMGVILHLLLRRVRALPSDGGGPPRPKLPDYEKSGPENRGFLPKGM